MNLWKILVLGTLRLNCKCNRDYDDLASYYFTTKAAKKRKVALIYSFEM